MADISWGKCTIGVSKYSSDKTEFDFTELGTSFHVIDTPVNGSTTINIEEGEKHEAEIEGGGNEAVRYDDDKISVEFDVRRAAGRKLIAGNGKIGQIDGTYMLAIQPESTTAPSILIEAANLKRSISFTSADGIYDHYVFDALVPKTGQAVKIGQLSQIAGTKNTRAAEELFVCTKIESEKSFTFFEVIASYL